MKDQFDFSIKLIALQLNNDDSLCVINSYSVDKCQLIYRAEGNANIVISLASLQKIIRLPKYDSAASSKNTTKENRLENIVSIYKYMKCISRQLRNELLNTTLVSVEVSSLNLFNQWLHQYRPEERCHRIVLPNGVDYGLLENDAALLSLDSMPLCDSFAYYCDTYSIEIKPKQGWSILQSNILRLFNVNRKIARKCRFCAMQYLKLKRNQIDAIGKYCPLDLFSGNTARMKNALLALINSPQNNFRIFQNGNLIYSENNHKNMVSEIVSHIFGADSFDLFINLLIKMLLNNNDDIGIEATYTTPTKNLDFEERRINPHGSECTNFDDKCLPDNCILKSILNTQLLAKTQMLLLESAKSLDSNLLYIDSGLVQNLTEVNVIDECNEPATQSPSEQLYSIGATALDCSIMLTFQRIPIDSRSAHSIERRTANFVEVGEQQFAFKASVIDLDPKPSNKHYQKYKQSIVASYAAYEEFLGKFKIDLNST